MYWLDVARKPRAESAAMPLDLTDAEMATAAAACRAMAFQEELRGKSAENPSLRAPVESSAKRYAALAAKFEAERKRRDA
jgi:hypothetical protein